jgi:glucoamylase
MILTSFPYHISNTSSMAYNCTMNPYDNGYMIHASGNCVTTAPISLPITDASPACEHAKTVSLSFPVEVRTEYGDNIFIVGSIPELGNWDLSRAVPLNANEYTTQPNHMVWNGGDVEVAAGTTFEWKAVQQNADGSWLWECGENWIATTDKFTCGKQTIGNDPTWFRCGNH